MREDEISQEIDTIAAGVENDAELLAAKYGLDQAEVLDRIINELSARHENL